MFFYHAEGKKRSAGVGGWGEWTDGERVERRREESGVTRHTCDSDSRCSSDKPRMFFDS